MAGRIAYYGNIVTSGLVLNLDAAKKDSYPGSGTTWRDISGNSYNGILTNGPTFSSDNYGSIVFDGVDDFVNFGNILNFGTGDFSLEAFVLYNNITSNVAGATISKDNFSGTTTYNGVLLNISSGINFQTRNLVNGSGPDTTVKFSTGLSTNTWYFIHGNRANNILYLYVNGILVNTSSESTATNVTNSQELRIGSLSNTAPQRLNGRISNVKMYNRALSASEVLQNYNATKGRYGL